MIPELKYDEKGLIPAIVQDSKSGDVLMMAYMNRQSLAMTLETGFTHFWSRSRQKYWKKGETSGHVQEVKEIFFDCDADTLLVKVIQHGAGACHTGNRTCFYRNITNPNNTEIA
jgi:phosphoribosyl-AMP cyclohydrolase